MILGAINAIIWGFTQVLGVAFKADFLAVVIIFSL